jgi:hypothetical protein
VRSEGAVVASGGDWDRWDLQVRGGLLGGARLRLGIEEHGSGQQLVRVRSWPRASSPALVLVALLTALAVLAGVGDATAAAILLAAFAVLALTRLLYECSLACAVVRKLPSRAFAEDEPPRPLEPEPPRANVAYLAEQMRMAPSKRAEVEPVAKR